MHLRSYARLATANTSRRSLSRSLAPLRCNTSTTGVSRPHPQALISHLRQVTAVPARKMHWRVNRHLCPPLIMIEDSITDDKLKKNVSWGFVVYRCTYSDDGAWQQMLQLIRDGVKSSLEAEGRMDLLPRHELIVMDDKARFDGATSHEIRDQFHRWVADEMMNRLAEPKEPDREAMLRSRPDDPGPEWFLGARYNFCLFVDNICLESLKKMRRPVVKLLWKQWGPREPNEREYPVHPDWEDGETDEEEEDVGWMYMAVTDYVEWYDLFHEPEHWYDAYSRPPSMISADTSEETPGFWRKG